MTRHSDSALLIAYIAMGSRKEAAASLHMTEPAFASRMTRLYRKFGAHSARELLLVLPDRAPDDVVHSAHPRSTLAP